LRRRLQRGLRLLAISHILATHGMAALAVRLRLFRPYAWLLQIFRREALPDTLGAQLRQALERLGPTFIKFGQMLSTRVDLLPLSVATELKRLQDEVPAEPFDSIRRVLERTYKRPLTGEGGVFASFDEKPVAAASIAQVHFATLHSGEEVAVKVRRPQVAKVIEADLSLLELLADLFDRYLPEYRRLKAPSIVQEFAVTIRNELNLRSEAAHANRFAENLAAVEGVRIPRVLWDYTTIEAMVTERIHGIPIDERERIAAAGHDTLKLCERAAALFFHMVFVDGYFHADMHPGNIFVDGKGEIVLVDFGIVGRLDMQSRRYLADMLLAFLKQNYRRAAEVHLEAGYVPADTNISAFEDALREIATPIFNRPLAEISLAELLYYLFAVTERFRMETRPELLLLQKTMVVIEGVARELEPSVNVWTLAKPLVSGWVIEHLGPRARVDMWLNDAQTSLALWMKLPQQLDRLLNEQRVDRAERSSLPVLLLGLLLASSGGAWISAAMLPAATFAPGGWQWGIAWLSLCSGLFLLLRRE